MQRHNKTYCLLTLQTYNLNKYSKKTCIAFQAHDTKAPICFL